MIDKLLVETWACIVFSSCPTLRDIARAGIVFFGIRQARSIIIGYPQNEN
jgi:hypothetical protein